MLKQNISFGAGFFAIYIATQGVAALAIPYYQMTLNLDPFYLGLTMTAPVLINTLFYTYIGKLLDESAYFKNKARVIVISGWLTALFFGLFWMAPIDASHLTIFIYLNATLTIFSFVLAILTIAAKCLVFEVFENRAQLNKQLGINTFAEKIGALTYYWMFPLAAALFVNNIGTGVTAIGWVIAFFIIGFLTTVMARLNKPGKLPASSVSHFRDTQNTHSALLNAVEPVRAKVNWILFNCLLMFGLLGIFVSFDYYLIVYFMFDGNVAEGAYWKGVMSTAYGLFGICYIPLVLKLCASMSLYKVLRLSYLLVLVGGPLKWWIFQPGNEYFIFIDALLGAAAWASIATVIPSMLGRISHDVQQKQGLSINGWLVSRHSLVFSISSIAVLSVSGMVLNIIGFDAAATATENTAPLLQMRYMFAGGTSLVALLLLILTQNRNRVC